MSMPRVFAAAIVATVALGFARPAPELDAAELVTSTMAWWLSMRAR